MLYTYSLYIHLHLQVLWENSLNHSPFHLYKQCQYFLGVYKAM